MGTRARRASNGLRAVGLRIPPSNQKKRGKTGQAGIDTIETGMHLLQTLANLHHPQMLKTVAAAADMPPSKAHRYLVSFIRTGFVGRDLETGRYQLGPSAMQLGLSALKNIDAVYAATQAIIQLRDVLNQTTSLAVWGSHGPTVLRFEEARRAVTVNARPGTVLSLLTSAAGQIFAAFMPNAKTAHLIRQEIKARTAIEERRTPASMDDVRKMIAEVRKQGLGRVMNDMIPGVSALAAPVFNHRGDVTVAIAIMGATHGFDARWNGSTADLLRKTASRISFQLGYSAGNFSPQK